MALAVLLVARTSVSFQFQSVAPLNALLEARFPLSLSGLGLLLGLYMAPGVIIALFLPTFTARFGRTPSICAAFALMACGEFLLWRATGLEQAMVARLIAGTGGCVIYIATINMVADLKTVIPSAARMGLIAAAWPFGNAMALALLGWLSHIAPELSTEVPFALIIVSLAATGVLLILDREQGALNHSPPSIVRWKRILGQIWKFALAFSLYNIAFIILTGFSGRILLDKGIQSSVASSIAGIPMWMFLLSVPFGGVFAGKSHAGDRMLVALGCVGGAIAVLASSIGSYQLPLYAIAGLLGGLPTAPLLQRARTASDEGTEMTYSALFFVFFVVLIVLPPLAGRVADLTGSWTILWIVAALLFIAAALFPAATRQHPGPAI
ncbi:MFS transporter [Hoeflea sp. G2-23]|uniref:MFS transporter n=2 Tax=Hoeflea algicola TaxID=2983763 RepID=A0ABT3ZD09_9HYPH|nr:MFS transporter [Hoeflea algicola]